MTLRPISLSIQSSTEIKILFSDELSNSISKSNISIRNVSTLDGLNIKSVKPNNRILEIVTEPQADGGFYEILLFSTENSKFSSLKGIELINDSNSRKIFFIGSEIYNPVRDRMILNAPSNYNLSNGIIRDFISINSDELYKAQRSAAELLSDNFIRQESKDEFRTRTSGKRDRFVNEGVFDIKRVSKDPTGFFKSSKTIKYDDTSMAPRHSVISSDPISLQEVYYEDNFTNEDLKAVDTKITLSNKNIIKILEISAIKDSEEYYYDIERFKYSLSDNKYDSNFSYRNSTLESNEFLISEQNNLGLLSEYESIKVSYLSKDTSINPQGEIEVYKVEYSESESIPYQKFSFYLKNFNIVNINGNLPQNGGVSFKQFHNGKKTSYFLKEIPFEAKMPSVAGEYSVNYTTGEVRVYGVDGNGVESSGIVAEYYYKRNLKKNFDYYIGEKDIVFNRKRLVVNNTPRISFEYENIFIEGIHYKNMSHVEVINERVTSNLSSSFSIKAKNSSINNVFRINNSTTGEVYRYLYSIGNQIYFSGFKSPEISDFKENLNANEFYEKISVSGENYKKIDSINVISVSGNSISISPIRAGKYNLNSNMYKIVIPSLNYILNIKKIIHSNKLITGFVLENSSEAPPVNSVGFISLKNNFFNLKNSNILDSSNTKIGSYVNSSALLNKKVYLRERRTNTLEKPGDYYIDYKKGILYFSIDDNVSNLDYIKYYASNYSLSKRNAITSTQIKRGDKYFFDKDIKEDVVYIKDLEEETSFIYEVDSNYEVKINEKFVKINKVFHLDDFLNEKKSDINFTLNKNGIDLKDSYLLKYREDGDNYYFDLKSYDKFFKIKNKLDIDIVSEDGLIFVENIYYKNIVNKKERIDVYLYNKDILNKIKKGDIIKNNNNNFIVTSSNKTLGIIEVTSEIDNVLLNEGFPLDYFSKINITNNVITINKNIINLKNEAYSVFEKIDKDLSPGSKLFLDMELSSINIEYKYLKDDIYISYEYGDNQIEWIDNDAILEGENYYVTYEYGAMRQKLKDNFGNLTQIPFFTKFPLSVDREFYRDAIEGTLSSFVKGPTIDSLKNITKSIVKTEPEIDEYIYKNWVLSRDHLPENSLKYNGNLQFFPVKFKEGMYFGEEENNYVVTSTNSHLSNKEGSISCWIRNDWNGIDNDADICFNLKTVGNSIYNLDLKESVYSLKNDISIIPTEYNIGILSQDKNELSLYNWDISGSKKEYGNFAINKNILNYTSGVKTKINFRKSVIFSRLNNLFLKDKINHSTILINDFTRAVSLNFIIENISENSSMIFYIADKKQDLIPFYFKNSNYILCECNDPEILDDYINIKNKKTEIKISSPFSLNQIRNNLTKGDLEQYCFIADENNNIYKISSIIEENNMVSKIVLFSAPINKGNIYSDSVNLKSNLIGSSFKIFIAYEEFMLKNNSYYISLNKKSPIYYTEFDKEYEYQISLDSKTNSFLFSRGKDLDVLFILIYQELMTISPLYLLL